MTIDIRATVTCSLGTGLISATISDDYVQGTGLIKSKGSCELSGIYTPNVGDEVTFSYTQEGITRQVPRKLRVLSSFADPFRRTTKVELGCKLTYLSDLQEPVDWTPFDDITNNEFTVDDSKIVTVPISASSIMDECLAQLGITASDNPLTSSFSVERFDLSPGYVQVLSDLLVSESYCGYLDKNEKLQVFSLDEEGGTGPVITAAEIIDLGPIGVGQLPGEAVVVSYSTLQLQAPDPDSNVDWEVEETIEVLQPVTITYDGDFSGSRTFTGRQITRTETTYETLSLQTAVSTGSWFYWQSIGQYKDVVSQRTTTVTSPSAYIEGKRVAELQGYGISYSSVDVVSSKTVETTTYSKTTGEPQQTERLTYEDRRVVYSRLNVPLAFSGTDYLNPSGLVLVGKDVTTYETSGDFTKTSTASYQWEGLTQYGSTRLAEAGATATNAAAISSLVETSLPTLVCTAQSVSTTQQGVTTYQGRPSSADLTNSAYASGGDPNNGWKTTSTAELELAVGSATAQRRIELQVPYPPDDIFTKVGNPPVYSYQVSDAQEKANRYGRVQNMLLLGNRSGMNLQMAASKMPTAPFDPIVIDANGLSALYRTNGTSWQIDSTGILASTDALFWGAVGGTGIFFFPVAPGVTTLPTAPAVVDTTPTAVLGTVEDVGANPQATLDAAFPSATTGEGVQDLATDEFWTYDGTTWNNVGATPGPTTTVTQVVPVWNETVTAVARTSTKLVVTSLSYPLTLLTEVAAVSKTKLAMRKITKVEVSSADVGLVAVPPVVSAGASVKPPACELLIATESLSLDVGNVSVTSPPAVIDVLGGSVEVSATLTAVKMPSATVSTAAVNPTIYTESDPYFANVSLLLRFEGANGSTIYTDSSNNAFSPSNIYGTAAITTGLYRFGAGGGDFNVPYSGTQFGTWTGTKNIVYSYSDGSALDLSAGAEFNGNEAALASSWTVEFWFYLPEASNNTPLTQGLMNIGNTVHRGYGIVVYLQQSGTAYYPTIQYGNKFQSSTYRRYTGQATSAAASVGWNHFAITYQLNTSDPFSSRLRLFINGYLAQDPNPVNGGGYGANYLYFSENKLLMGGCNITSEGTAANPGNKSQLTWDELRITKGIVRYAPDNYSQLTLGSSYFTPPTSRFPVA